MEDGKEERELIENNLIGFVGIGSSKEGSEKNNLIGIVAIGPNKQGMMVKHEIRKDGVRMVSVPPKKE